jgi:hypothetical protein
MHSAGLRSLALFVSLILVAPPGWCCVASRAEAPARHAACCGCPHCRETPAPAPAPKTPGKPVQCPCYDRQVTAPAGPTAFTAAPAVVTLVSAAAVSPELVGPTEPTSARLADSHLYLTHCAWRC